MESIQWNDKYYNDESIEKIDYIRISLNFFPIYFIGYALKQISQSIIY